MTCNPNKCKELFIKKKGKSTFYPVVRNIPQHATLELLGLTFQNDNKCFALIKSTLYMTKRKRRRRRRGRRKRRRRRKRTRGRSKRRSRRGRRRKENEEEEEEEREEEEEKEE